MICGFLVTPLIFIITYSFLTPGTYGGIVWEFSIDAYVQFLFERDLFTEDLVFSNAYLSIYGRSAIQALVATVICLIIGFPTAYFIATRPLSQRTAWVFLITVPYWINLLIRTVSMLFIIRDEGPINNALIAIGITSEPIRMAYTDFGIALGLVYSYLPFMVLPIYASIERFDFRLMEAAYDLYSDRWTILRKIVLPITRPGIVAGSLLVFIPSLGSFIAPDLLGGGGHFDDRCADRADRLCPPAGPGGSALDGAQLATHAAPLSRFPLGDGRLPVAALRADDRHHHLFVQLDPLDHHLGRFQLRLVSEGLQQPQYPKRHGEFTGDCGRRRHDCHCAGDCRGACHDPRTEIQRVGVWFCPPQSAAYGA
jgi:spermidine/putrescine transport system permease protein